MSAEVITLRRALVGRPGRIRVGPEALVVVAPALREPWRWELPSIRGFTFLYATSLPILPMPQMAGRLWSANLAFSFVEPLPCPDTRGQSVFWRDGEPLRGIALAVRDPARAADILESAGIREIQLDDLEDWLADSSDDT